MSQIGEAALWLRVIQRAVMDADAYATPENWPCERPCTNERLKLKRRAIRWLTLPNKNYYIVCEFAGISCEAAGRFQERFRRRYAVSSK